MSFQSYLDNIKTKTGKTAEDFKALAKQNGLLKPGMKAGEIVNWLKNEYALGHGHAMAIYSVLKGEVSPDEKESDLFEKHFSGKKAQWKPAFEAIGEKVKSFGEDVEVKAGESYITLLRGKKKFAIVQTSGPRLDLGFKIKGEATTQRFEPAQNWNSMVTHRAKIESPDQMDAEIFKWLEKAYNANK